MSSWFLVIQFIVTIFDQSSLLRNVDEQEALLPQTRRAMSVEIWLTAVQL